MERCPSTRFQSQVHARSGFSLLEVIIVIAILGILLAIVAWQFPSQSARAYANDVRAILLQGRYEAIKRNRPIAVLWSEANQEFFTVLSSAGGDDPCSTGTVLLRASSRDYARTSVTIQIDRDGGLEAIGDEDDDVGVVWLPSGQARSCLFAVLPRTIATIADPRSTREISISVAGKVEVR